MGNQLCHMKILSGTEILEDADMLHEGLKDDHCLLTSVVFLGLFFLYCSVFTWVSFLGAMSLLNFDIWDLHLYVSFNKCLRFFPFLKRLG